MSRLILPGNPLFDITLLTPRPDWQDKANLENSLNELNQSLENSNNQQLQEIEEIVAEAIQNDEVQQEEFPWGYYF